MAAHDHPLWDALRLEAPQDGAAWRRWRASADLDRLDPLAYRLLPLLAKKLPAWTVDDAQGNLLVGIVRRAWTENRLVYGKLQRVLELAGPEAVAPSGVAGCATAFAQSGCVRLLFSLDGWVAAEAFLPLLAQLERQGWQRQHFWPESAAQLVDGSGVVLTLRVKATPFAGPEALFVETITGPEVRAELPWRYDAEFLLRQASGANRPVDWPQIRQRLREINFPPLAYRRLRQLRLAGVEIPWKMLVRPGALRASWDAVSDAYARQPAHTSFITFLARRWGVTPWRIPTEIIARTFGKAN